MLHLHKLAFVTLHFPIFSKPHLKLKTAMEEDKESTLPAAYRFLWNTKEKGGFRATMFIYVMVALENMGFIANMVSMVLYFMYVMYFDLPGSATTLTNFVGTTFMLTLVGGFISDTYLTRFTTCIIFGFIEILALMLITIQAYYKKLQPHPCENKTGCLKGNQALMFYASLYLYALGCGGVRGSLPSLGGEQFNPKKKKSLATYFNWLLLSTTVGASFGVTFIVYVSTNNLNKKNLAEINKGWAPGFLLCMVGAIVGFVVLILGRPFYRIQTPGYSPIIRVTQVIVASFRNRKLSLPEKPEELYEINDKKAYNDDEKLQHTSQFSFFDKAAILPKDHSTPNAWKVCTVTQVEEVKVLTRMLPIILSTILMNTCLAQLQTFSIQQGSIMDLQLGTFKVPAASIPVIPLVFMSILIPIYEFFFVPFARKITKHPSGITQLQRVGVGLVLSAISMGIAGIVEVKRRNHAINNPTSKPISLFWLSFQFAVFGIADMFTMVGLLEFFYKEAPSGMRSLSTSFTWLSLSIGYFLSSVIVEIINSVTKSVTKSKQGWLVGIDLNKNKLNLFYWFLAILSVINFGNYLFWASWYKYKIDDDAPNGSIDHYDQMIPSSPIKQVDHSNDDGILDKEEEFMSIDQDVHEMKQNGASSPLATTHIDLDGAKVKEAEDKQEE